MKKIILPGLLAGIIMLAVGMGIMFISNALLPSLEAEYQNIALFRPWEDPLMSLYFAYPFILGFLLAWAWNKIKSVINGTSAWTRGVKFGASFWLLSSIPGMWITYSSFQISLIMVIVWALSGLLEIVLSSWVYPKLNA